jgi:hypothetical protein
LIPDRFTRISAVVACAAAVVVCSLPSAYPLTGTEKAWSIFESAAKGKSASQRAIGIRALGRLFDANVRVRFTAAAAVIRLDVLGRKESLKDPDKKTAQTKDAAHSDSPVPASR